MATVEGVAFCFLDGGVFKDAGTAMGAGRDATLLHTYNAKEGRLKSNRTVIRRKYDELLANRELPYPKKKAGK